ncbi:MAG: metallophosphoesterase [Armatimonadetes bacterium]|nr:metallophosphoesterase [Armatimonadota bacterium]MDW8028401.1 metallophosphoesterase [Armatimonadota bacterium]
MSLAERLRLAILLWFVLTIAIGQFIVVAVWIAERLGKGVRNSQFTQPKVRLTFTLLFTLLALCFFYAAFIEPNWLELTEVDLSTTKLNEGTKLTLVQLSDLHSTGKERLEKRLLSIVNSYRPDLIFLKGDYLNSHDGVPIVRKLLRRLKAKHGIFAVMGNWDVWYFADVPVFEGTKVKVLDGDTVRLKVNGCWVYIAGVSVENEGALEQSLRKRRPTDFAVLLYHSPDLIEDASRLGVDLYLSGHTHGGQVALPFYGAIITLSRYGKRFERGLHQVGNTLMYVNRGIGFEGGFLPLRFCSRPEVTVFRIDGIAAE